MLDGFVVISLSHDFRGGFVARSSLLYGELSLSGIREFMLSNSITRSRGAISTRID